MLRTILFFLAVLFFLPLSSYGQITTLGSWSFVDDGGTAETEDLAAIPAGTDRLLVITITVERSTAGAVTLGSVVFGGQPMTEVVQAVLDQRVIVPANTTNIAGIWYCNEACIAASAGVTLTFNMTPNPSGSEDPVIAWVTYSGVDQANPVVDSATATCIACTTVSTTALTTVNGGKSVYAAIGDNDPTPAGPHFTPGAGYTERVDKPNVTNAVWQVTTADTDGNTTGAPITPSATISATVEMAIAGATFRGLSVTSGRRPTSTRTTR